MIRKFYLLFGIISLALIPFVPIFKVIDRIGPQYLYLSVIQVTFSIIFLLFFRKDFSVIKHKIVSINFYAAFLMVALCSIIFSNYKEESILEWFKHFTNFHTLLNIFLLFCLLPKRIEIFTYIFLALSLIESIYIFYIFCDFYSVSETYFRFRALQGFSSNQNIGSFSLLMKLPVLFYLAKTSKNKILVFLSIVAIVLSVFDIQIIASRATLLGTVLFLSIVVISFIFQYRKTPNYLRVRFISILLLVAITVVIQNKLISEKNTQLVTTNRILSYQDSSIAYRVGYIFDALNHFKKYPIIGTGIGTWKIYSIGYVHEDQTEYQAPYHAHNDFLQLFAETGIFGGFFYLMIFVFTILEMIRKLFTSKTIYLQSIYFYILLCLFIFCLDSSVNFPRIRPYSQMNIIYVLGLIFSIKASDEN